MKPQSDNFERHLAQLKRNGWFFASNKDQEESALTMVKEGILKPLSEVVPDYTKQKWIGVKSTWLYAYVKSDDTVENLPNYFTLSILNDWGIYEFGGLNYEI